MIICVARRRPVLLATIASTCAETPRTSYWRRPACVPGKRRGEDVVAALERRQDELPGPPRVHEAVQADERRTGAAAMRSGEPDQFGHISPDARGPRRDDRRRTRHRT